MTESIAPDFPERLTERLSGQCLGMAANKVPITKYLEKEWYVFFIL
jgi:hypothetical protein